MPTNPESTWITQVYRRILSPRVRHRIHRRVPIRLRTGVKRSLAQLSPDRTIQPVRSGAARLRARIVVAAPDARMIANGQLVGRVRPDALTALGARRANLVEVTDALDAADVPYFAIRGRFPARSTVAVPREHAERAFGVLADRQRSTGGYHAVLWPEQRMADLKIHQTGRAIDAAADEVIGAALYWHWTDADGTAVLGADYACDVEVWDVDEHGDLVARRRNLVSEVVAGDEPDVEASDSRMTALAPVDRDPLPAVRTKPTFDRQRPEDVSFPVDVVFTWVDGSDEAWRRRRAQVTGETYHAEANNDERYLDREELRYALRSLHAFAPWVRTIYLVTDQQVPAWLDQSVPGLVVVDHTEIFSDPDALPTYNSHAIESQLHRIEGLSEHFLYLNDDMMLGRPVTPETFFASNGISYFYPSPATVPFGPPRDTDVPVNVAAKNNRRLLSERLGTSLTNKMKHAPYPLRRSVLEEIEREFPAEHAETMRSRFRSRDDYSFASSFHHWYGFATGRAMPGRIAYRYVDLGLPDARRQLGIILAERRFEAICLNTTVSTDDDLTSQEIGSFLQSYFPVPSPFEA